MQRADVHVSTDRDYVIIPRPYTPFLDKPTPLNYNRLLVLL